MKSYLILFVLLLASPGLAQTSPAARKPLDKDQVMALVTAGMDNAQLAKKIEDLGIDFEPTDDYLEALRKAGAQDVLLHALRATRPEPMTQQQVLALVAGGVPSERARALVKQHGIVFVPDERYLETLRVAGADDALIAAVREAGGALPGELDIRTSPNAEIYLDGARAGQADYSGTLALKKLKPGSHALRVTLATKRDFEQSVTVMPAAVSNVNARLTDLPGRVVVTSEAGAEVYLDGKRQGKTDSNGKLVLADVAPGYHNLRVTGQTKHKDYFGTLNISAGQEISTYAMGDALPGSIRVRAGLGAQIFFDNHTAPNVPYYNGEYKAEYMNGAHTVRVVQEGQPEFRRSVFVPDGDEVVVDTPHTAMPMSEKRIEGLYRSLSHSGDYYDFLWFSPSGTVILNALAPSRDDVESVMTQIKSRGFAYAYQVQGSTVRFSVNRAVDYPPTCIGEVDYKANIKGNTLVTESRSTCDGKVTKDTFTLVGSGAAGAR